MLIRSMRDVEAEGRVISISHGRSSAVRVLIKGDGLGFSVSEARCGAGNTSELWYKNHWEANFVRAGRGWLENRSTEQRWDLVPGVLYCVGPTDRHRVINSDDQPLRIISVFNPPIVGDETHDEDGAYPPSGNIPPGQPEMFVRTIEDARAAGRESIRYGGAARVARYLVAEDGLGFSFSDVHYRAGREGELWYKNHWEANLVLEGTLEVTDYTADALHTLGAGGLYCVGPEDRHRLKAVTDVHLVSVFNPPLIGQEAHDADGSYEPSGTLPPGPR